MPAKGTGSGGWTLGEVAEKLAITVDAVEKMIAAGKFTGLPTGYTSHRVPNDEVQRLLRKR